MTRLWQGQTLTVFLLILGYAGYYLCRSYLSVLTPQLILELQSRGMEVSQAKITLGVISSIGVIGYAFGKFLNGGLLDFLGGRRGFLIGMLGVAVFTVLFGLGGGVSFLTLVWLGNRLFQSMGWLSIVKITSRWFSYKNYGTAMGVISLSYLFGDAFARKLMSGFLSYGMSWQQILFVAAGILFSIFVVNFAFLKESPSERGLVEPPTSPCSLFGEGGQKPKPESLRALLSPLVRSRSFWIICLLSLGSTLVRETFNNWVPTYFYEVLGLSHADAAAKSAWFPFLGGFSVLLAGVLSDRLGRGGRSMILFFGLLMTSLILICLAFVEEGSGSSFWPVTWVSLVGFFLLGPYSYLGGAISLDFGGKQGSATVCGIMDGIGCIGGFLAGGHMAEILVTFGWRWTFFLLALISALSSLAAAALGLMSPPEARVVSLDIPQV